MITTVIFDMDGTVLNTLDDLAASVNYVLTRYGMPVHCTEDYRRYFGNGIRYALQCAVPKGSRFSGNIITLTAWTRPDLMMAYKNS